MSELDQLWDDYDRRESEMNQLRDDYDNGRLDSIKGHLAQFVVVNKPEIEAIRRDFEERDGQPFSDVVAIEFHIIRRGTVNPSRDLHNTSPDGLDSNITAIIYCFLREQERYLRLFHDA